MASESTPPPSVPGQPSQLFWRVLAATALIKVLLAVFFPVTGDEAYFLIWGRHLDYGYYDHPGMTGWWLWLMLQISDASLVVRLPALVTPLIVAWLIRRVVRQTDPGKEDIVGALFLVSPANLLNFFTTTDTPVFFFGFLAAFWTWRGWRRDHTGDYLVGGLFLGAAFFAKYFAVPLGLALGAFILVFGGRRRLRHFIALAAGVVPWAALNIHWLYWHNWTNILFNFYNRNQAAEFTPYGPLVVFAFIVIYLGPAVAWFLLRPNLAGRLPLSSVWRNMRESGLHVFAVAAGLPLAIFFVVSLVKSVGLHWLLTFAPFLFLVLAPWFDVSALRRMFRPTLTFTAMPIVLLAVLLPLPPEAAKSVLQAAHREKDYESIVLGMYPEEVFPVIAPYAPDYTLMSASYAKAAVLAYHSRSHVPVFGDGSYHARQDDFITDFRDFDGHNIMVLTHRERDAEVCRPWFDGVEIKKIDARDAHLLLILCRGFHYDAYRDGVLRGIVRDHYSYPTWMKSFARPGPFAERYGFDEVMFLDE